MRSTSPSPRPGRCSCVRSGIPFNLNDLERITGGNMMVRPELPYSPGHGDDGHRRRVRAGHRGTPRPACRRHHPAGPRGIRRVRDLSRGLHLRDARRRSRCPTRPRCSSRSTSPGSDCSTGPSSRRGRRCSSTPAAGGAGSAAIQLAVDAGAHVIATVGSDEKIQLCRDLGAETVVNYRTEGFADVVPRADRRQGRRRGLRQRRRGGHGGLVQVASRTTVATS